MGKFKLRGSNDDAMEMDLDMGEEDRRRKRTKKEAVEVEMEEVHSAEVDGSHRILPKMVLRVLLVEADDSTRRIVAALLRKCSYRVSAVPDGLKAWETLKGRPHNVDLILTEVDLPSISGYALLTLVMEHDICKNIPVIMMSSCDTVSLVLKCMLKGAADFLIKPIRKNELKNLWQHVWRRHTIGGKIPMNLTEGQHKVEATSDDVEASDHSGDYVASGKKIEECSEKGSDTQSSCTTPYMEVESGCVPNMQGLSPLKDGIAPNLNMDIEQHRYSAYIDKEFDTLKSDIKEKSEYAAQTEASDTLSSRMKENHGFAELRNQNVVVRPEFYRVNADSTCEINDYNNERTEASGGVIDLIGKFGGNQICIDSVYKFNDNEKHIDGASSCIDTSTSKVEFSPHLELSLRRIFPGKSENQGNEKALALNHSNVSAFSSYNSGNLMKRPSLMLSNAPTKSETSASLPSLLSGNSGCTSQGHGISASNSQKNVSTKVVGLSGMLDTRSTCQQEHSIISVNASFQNCYDNTNSRQIHHQYEETTNNTIGRASEDDSPATHSASSSLCNGTDNINSNAYGSMCSRAVDNTSSTVAHEKPASYGNTKSTGTFTCEGYKGLDSHRSRHREAALEKFRLKRKDRCYEKKVRYQSRKRLAEQRPRVKGQFVRHQPTDPPVSNAGCQ